MMKKDSKRPWKVMPIFGSRPEGIKMAPVVKASQNDPDFSSVFVNTAQRRDMLDQVLISNPTTT